MNQNTKKVGLALGGGAARGFAHIGVLQVLNENRIPVDLIAGCSMGSVIGALYVTGADMYFLEQYVRAFDILQYVDVSVRKGGFVGGKKIEKLLAMLTKYREFKDADIPFACVAVNVEEGVLRAFTEGLIYRAVRASISIPGVFAPIQIEGKTYVDGGVLDRVPAQAARELGADVVIGVDVSYRGEPLPKPRSLFDVTMDSFDIAMWQNEKRKTEDFDLLLVPKVREVDAYSTKDAQLCIKRGREAALESLDQIKEVVFA